MKLRIRSTRQKNPQAGFTLIEAVLIIIIMAVMAAVIMPQLGNLTGSMGSSLARKLQSDIAYGQELAMTHNLRYRVYFNAAPAPAAGYAVVNNSDGDGNWGEAGEFAADPTGSGNLSVTLNAGDYAGITISVVGFTGSYVEFNALGVPSDGGGVLGAAKSVTVSGGGATKTVTVQPDTGKVSSP